MTTRDRWLEEPYQQHYAQQEAADYLEEHTCPRCRVVQQRAVDRLCEACELAQDIAATEVDDAF